MQPVLIMVQRTGRPCGAVIQYLACRLTSSTWYLCRKAPGSSRRCLAPTTTGCAAASAPAGLCPATVAVLAGTSASTAAAWGGSAFRQALSAFVPASVRKLDRPRHPTYRPSWTLSQQASGEPFRRGPDTCCRGYCGQRRGGTLVVQLPGQRCGTQGGHVGHARLHPRRRGRGGPGRGGRRQWWRGGRGGSRRAVPAVAIGRLCAACGERRSGCGGRVGGS